MQEAEQVQPFKVVAAVAEAKGIQEMNNVFAGSGGEAIVKLRIAEAI